MQDLFTSGHIADVIIALMVVESVVLISLGWARGRGIPPLQIITTIGAGLCLVLALRAAMTASDWRFIAAFLAAALIAHLADLLARWPR